ncbi:DNA-directed RNA polymerase III subunit RPC10 [Penicillium chermesinum]|uniref:DNA-directed RNA polymerase subunit n=1 Tax=Penicillium chermesinum TaxID=63820 RepID=A0A9W9N866_9EURO|nr:DNA-directed RNA polymerase III subunit RPC10 [Penicillium chermesinum]KAJ5215050.1 DNA-directed RNA polymerase III subunit RPC10 [Penicillium chermesinum]KAJ6141455.1 DNA-directed RNA polymerase III subunit RPC10 [Penicillium chermesinum]
MPLIFCPNCSNALTFARSPSTNAHPTGINRFECRTCPYVFEVVKKYSEETGMKEKEVEEVFGGEDEWKNADSCETQCPAEGCNGERAYFYQVQIRSADEPMTTFLRCTTCGKRWREN